MKFVLNGTHKADYYPSHANFCIASYIWTLFEGRLIGSMLWQMISPVHPGVDGCLHRVGFARILRDLEVRLSSVIVAWLLVFIGLRLERPFLVHADVIGLIIGEAGNNTTKAFHHELSDFFVEFLR